MPKMLHIFSIFNTKMAMQKFTNFDKYFKKSMLIQQLLQYNLTKLFPMKLKTTRAILQKKPNELFGQPYR